MAGESSERKFQSCGARTGTGHPYTRLFKTPGFERLMRVMGSKSVVVLIPAYNEDQLVGKVVQTSANFATRVIVVDDGSTDRTGDVAHEAGAHVVKNARNLGLGRTIRRGYE